MPRAFEKQALPIRDQISLLRDRGLSCPDEARTARYLRTIGYFRLKPYWDPFLERAMHGPKRFRSGTNFDQLLELYIFDRKLRLLMMEVIERIEISLRSAFADAIVNKYTPHAHMNAELFCAHRYEKKTYEHLCLRLNDMIQKQAQNPYVVHYRQRYHQPVSPPFWAIAEMFSLGELLDWFQATSDNDVLDDVAVEFGIPKGYRLAGALHALKEVRNISAHHGRLWNKRFSRTVPILHHYKPEFAVVDKRGQTDSYEALDNRMYNILVLTIIMMHHLSPQSTYRQRLLELVQPLPSPLLEGMGFPQGWETRRSWTGRIRSPDMILRRREAMKARIL